jgi:CubicO group peptidase (beta-lactamase class C family)
MDISGLDEFLEQNDFSGAVLIKRGNTTIFEAALGKASPRWDASNTVDTRFDSNAITKLFTSVAVLQQVSKGELDLETSIHHYVDLVDSEIDPAVTLLHVLTHTSGIADDVDEDEGETYAELWAEFPTYMIMEPADQLPTFINKQSLAAPGVECAYSNAGYVLAGLALEKVTEGKYRQYIFDEVFTPAGMIDSGFYDRRDAAPRVAEGWDFIDGRWVSNIYSAPPIGLPDSGAHVTAGDLVRFIQALRAGELLNAETWYGFGLEFDMNEDGSVRSYFADGVGPGASGIVRHYLEDGLDVVVLSNSQEYAWPVIREIDERLGG